MSVDSVITAPTYTVGFLGIDRPTAFMAPHFSPPFLSGLRPVVSVAEPATGQPDLQHRTLRATVGVMDQASPPQPSDRDQPSLGPDKPALRRLALQRRAALGAQERLMASRIVAATLVRSLPDMLNARGIRSRPLILAGYWPIRDEIDPRPAMAELEQLGFGLALPAIDRDQLLFRRYRSTDTLVKGPFNTSEPAPDQPVLSPDIILVPLVGFDRNGHRLGYGAGFYDRTLAGFGPKRPFAIGLAFACQWLDDLPVEPHDQPLDGVLTERDLRLRTV